MTFIYTGLAYGQTNMIDYYKQAMPLILNSNEFKGYLDKYSYDLRADCLSNIETLELLKTTADSKDSMPIDTMIAQFQRCLE